MTDVAAVTGFPEMLDGRVKTLHPRIHAGLLADRRLADHREALAAAGIAPFELVVVNLYPFAEAARTSRHRVRRPGRGDRHRWAVDGPGGGQEPRVGRDRDVARPLRGRPRRARRARRRCRSASGRRSPSRPSATRPPTTPASPSSCPPGCTTAGVDAADRTPACRRRRTRTRRRLTISMEKVETLRYGENPHQPAARYRRTAASPSPARGRSRPGEPPLQGKALTYNNVLDASAAAALARLLRGPAVVIVKHTNPCGAAERADSARGMGCRPRRRPGVRVRRRGRASRVPSTGRSPRRLTRIFLEVIVAPGVRRGRARGAGRRSRTCG